jgi:hypothetical protein
LIKGQETLIKMDESPYEKELDLQRLLVDYPDLIPGDQIDNVNPRRWLLISQEMPLPSEQDGSDCWSVDHLFVDQDGIPTIVETKRSCDTRIRREVVGQLLEYAANGVIYWPIERLIEIYGKSSRDVGKDPDTTLDQFLLGAMSQEDFWKTVSTNLELGKVRLLFVADQIPDTLRRIVEFLNGQMKDAEVLAIEIKQFVAEDHKALVPRVIGQTSVSQARKKTVRTERHDEGSFMGSIDPESSALHRALIALPEGQSYLLNWTGTGYSLYFRMDEQLLLIMQANTGSFGSRLSTTFWIIRDRVPGSERYIEDLRTKLEATELFQRQPSGELKLVLDGPISENDVKKIITILNDSRLDLMNIIEAKRT